MAADDPGQIPARNPGQIPGQTPGQIPGQTPGQTPFENPAQVLARHCADALWAADRASQAMGMKLESVAPGKSSASMTVRAEMMGPGGACSRGAIFLLADSALAFAANTGGHRAG